MRPTPEHLLPAPAAIFIMGCLFVFLSALWACLPLCSAQLPLPLPLPWPSLFTGLLLLRLIEPFNRVKA